MSRVNYLAKNTALFALNSIGTKLIVFLLVPIYTYTLSTADYGIVDILTTFSSVAIPIITLNINEAVMRFSLDKDNKKNDTIGIGLVFMLLSLVMGISIIPVCKMLSRMQAFARISEYSVYIYLYCVSYGIFLICSYSLRGQEKLLKYAISNIINTFLSAVINILFLVFLHLGIKGYFSAFIISNLTASFYSLCCCDLKDVIKNFSINKKLMGQMVKYSILLVPNSLMWWIMNSSDRFMVTSFMGESANGIYAISYKIPSVLAVLNTVYNQAWSYSAIHENDSSDKDEFSNKMYNKLFSFLIIVTSALIFIMKPFTRIYVQKAYYESWKYTPYLLIGFFFMALGSFLSTSYTVNKDSRGFLISGTFGAAFNIALNWLLIPKVGIAGAAFATCVSYFAVYAFRIFDTRKYIKLKAIKTKYIFEVAILIIMGSMMFIDNIMGYIGMGIGILFLIVIERRFIVEMVNMAKAIILKKKSQ